MTIHDSKNSPSNLGDTHVDVVGALAYVKAFMVGEEPASLLLQGMVCSS